MTRHDLEKEIRSFAHLAEGWSFGEGGPISACLIDKALRSLHLFNIAKLKARAFPNLDGTIQLSFTHGESFFDITFNEDDTIELIHERGIGSNYEEIACLECSLTGALMYILKNSSRAEACPSSESLTPDFSTPTSSASSLERFPLRLLTNASQSSLSHASADFPKTKGFVRISSDTILGSPEFRPCTGYFHPTHFIAGQVYKALPQKQETLVTA